MDSAYKGIWYGNQKQEQYGYKYSGGLATYPQQQMPVALYDAVADTTFFVFGGDDGKGQLENRIGAFDHRSGTVCRPHTILHRPTWDAHYNAVIAQDAAGYLFVFCNSHGVGMEMKPGDPTYGEAYVYRSRAPHTIAAGFERIYTDNFSYSNVWTLADGRLFWLHTRYQTHTRPLFWSVGDGSRWSEPVQVAFIEKGNYQISACQGAMVATVFDMHPEEGGLNARTNIYYLQTADAGQTWTTVAGVPVSLPLTECRNPALVHDFAAEGLLVYLKDVTFDQRGHPIITYLTTHGAFPGPANGPRQWWTARWDGREWVRLPITASSHNYDHGILCVDDPGDWRLIAPTAPGPQPHGTGGTLTVHSSVDQGRTWQCVRQYDEIVDQRNHTYVRRPLHAHPGFMAIWADGDAYAPSDSCLYFMDQDGTVYQLPDQMPSATMAPQRVAHARQSTGRSPSNMK